mgnify:CR=1 FL=1|tara:strand:- start:355 stop:498 length:144 start_codon:yes stop_codon:yes gene_type:complete
MNEKLTPNNSENDEYTDSISEIDYQNLINRLKDIKSTIALLEKTILI